MATTLQPSAQRVLQLLAATMAPTDPARATSERELQQLLKAPATMALLAPLLQQIVLLPDSNQYAHVMQLDTNLRLMAVLWLKQFLKQQWKPRNEHLSEDERSQLKHVLLFAALHEPHATIALHLALILAQIARAEFPTQWPFEQLFTPILHALQASVEPSSSPTPQQQLLEQRSVDLLYRTVKELATRRLAMHRKQFALLSVALLPLLQQHWHATATNLSEHLWRHCEVRAGASAPTSAALEAAARRFAVLQPLTKLLAALFAHAFRDLVSLERGDLVRSALIQFYERLEGFVQFRLATLDAIAAGADATDVTPVLAAVDALAHKVAHIVVLLQETHAIAFREYLAPFLTLFWRVLMSQHTRLPQRLQIDAMQFVANVLGCRLYKRDCLTSGDGSSSVITKVITAAGDVALTDAMVSDALATVTTFFSDENRFDSLLRTTVMQSMRLQPTDLDDWSSDPEAFAALSESLTAHESVRASGEHLFLTLLQHYPTQTLPALTHMTAAATTVLHDLLAASSSADSVGDTDSKVLDVDAVLLALGLGCYDLHGVFDFEPWFLTTLAPVLVAPMHIGSVHGLPVLRTRIVWLVSCWLAQLSASIRPQLYDALLQPAMLESGDAMLTLRVVQTLEAVVSDWGFDADAFAPFVPRALAFVFAVFPQTETAESKLKVLACLEALVHACPALAVASSAQISAVLPAMWLAESDASNLVRCKILELLTALVASAKGQQDDTSDISPDSVATLVAMCFEVVRFATDISNPDEVFLMESGLALWRAALSVSRTYTPELHVLFANVVRLLQRDYEHVTLALALVQQHVRLGRTHFWQTYYASVALVLSDVLGSVKAEAGVELARTFELIVATFPTEQLTACAPALARMADACVQFANKDASREPEMVVVAYLSVLARLLVVDPAFAAAHVLVQQGSGDTVVTLMLDKFFSVGSSSLSLVRRKVWALALCAILPTLSDTHVDTAGQILELVTEVLDAEEEAAATTSDSADDEAPSSSAGAYRAYRMHKQSVGKAVSDEDARVQQTDLKALACAKLNELATRLGAARFEALLQSVDSSVVRKLQS